MLSGSYSSGEKCSNLKTSVTVCWPQLWPGIIFFYLKVSFFGVRNTLFCYERHYVSQKNCQESRRFFFSVISAK